MAIDESIGWSRACFPDSRMVGDAWLPVCRLERDLDGELQAVVAGGGRLLLASGGGEPSDASLG